MSTLKAQTLREMTRAELLQKRVDLEDERFNLQMRRSLKQLDNPLRLRHIGREVAKLLTVLRENDLGVRTISQQKSSLLSESAKGKGK
jgi:large subunit ribosomal protein L29